MNLDLLCGWQTGQKHGPMVCDTEKGVSEVTAVCASVSTCGKCAHNATHEGCFENEKGHVKH